MKKIPYLFILLSLIGCSKSGDGPKTGSGTEPDKPIVEPVEIPFDGTKRASTSYQLLVYSFADSDGDGIGDFKGIEQHLDYLDGLGVTALWLSPIFPASSYHGYDASDYFSVNPEYGTEEDFKSLLSAAHAKDIDIYLDFVLNHTGKDHPWFLEACANPNSPYRDYYIFSEDPTSDIAAGKIAMISTEGAAGYDAGQWFAAPSSSLGASGRLHFRLEWVSASAPKVTVTQTDAQAQPSNSDSSVNKFLYYGDGKMARLYQTGSNVYEITLDFDSSWGFLIRTSQNSWDGGTKYGCKSGDVLAYGVPMTLNNTQAADIVFGKAEYFHSHFWTSWMPDLNYGPASEASSSAAFGQMTAAADKWIKMGVDGLRLDAVKHIYHNENSDENPTFLSQFYDHCNATYKSAGHSGDIFMVGEVFSDANSAYKYYKGLPSVFEFSFWWELSSAINSGDGRGFVSKILSYRKKYEGVRAGAIASTKLSNHDEDRAAGSLGKSLAKEKLAAAVLLTAEGKPFIYQGEELGYWGDKSKDDKWVRTPIRWTAGGALADKYLQGCLDNSMLTDERAVSEALTRASDTGSLLRVYMDFAKIRNTYPALASGKMSECASVTDKNVAAWYMTGTSGPKFLVVHNFSDGLAVLTVPEELGSWHWSTGSCKVDSKTVTLGSYASAVITLK